jgi:hypothetical protein
MRERMRERERINKLKLHKTFFFAFAFASACKIVTGAIEISMNSGIVVKCNEGEERRRRAVLRVLKHVLWDSPAIKNSYGLFFGGRD